MIKIKKKKKIVSTILGLLSAFSFKSSAMDFDIDDYDDDEFIYNPPVKNNHTDFYVTFVLVACGIITLNKIFSRDAEIDRIINKNKGTIKGIWSSTAETFYNYPGWELEKQFMCNLPDDFLFKYIKSIMLYNYDIQRPNANFSHFSKPTDMGYSFVFITAFYSLAEIFDYHKLPVDVKTGKKKHYTENPMPAALCLVPMAEKISAGPLTSEFKRLFKNSFDIINEKYKGKGVKGIDKYLGKKFEDIYNKLYKNFS